MKGCGKEVFIGSGETYCGMDFTCNYVHYGIVYCKDCKLETDAISITRTKHDKEDSWYCEQCGKEMNNTEDGVSYQKVGYCSNKCVEERKALE